MSESFILGDRSSAWYNVPPPEGLVVEGPVYLWDRALTNEELTLALSGDLAAILTLDPIHVRYPGDVGEDGECRCLVCRSRE